MTIQRLKPDAMLGTPFDYDTIYPFMGLNEGGASIMSSPGNPPQWPHMGFFGMGYYLYGSNLNSSFLGGWDVSDAPNGPKTQAKATIQTTWANRITPWFLASPASDNTCTNAAIRILNAQVYIKSASTGLWTRADVGCNNLKTTTKYQVGGFTSDGNALRIFPDSINLPAFPFCPASADWATDSALTTKYRLLHGAVMPRVVLSDPSDLAGILCTFESQLVSTNGLALNGAPNFLVQAGADAGYNDDALGAGALLGAPYVPAIGGSRWSAANNDGTRRTHYFGTFLHADSFQDLTSAYNVGGGVSKLTAAQLQANMPTRIYQPQV